MLPDTAQSFAGWMLGCRAVLGGSLGATVAARDVRCLYKGSLQNKLLSSIFFSLFAFFGESENPLRISLGQQQVLM